MQCYTELIPPSAVTHAITTSFINPKTKNLVIAKTSLLQIFDMKPSEKATGSSDRSSAKSKLVLVGEYPIAGTITHLDSIKALNTKSGGDALLLAVKDARVSLLEWDPENYKISTISIHYYEGENIPTLPFGPGLNESESILTVDPESRCAALKFGARNLAILPFRQSLDELAEGAQDGQDIEMDVAPPSATLKRVPTGMNETVERKTPYKASFVLSLTTLDPALTHPVDIAFLHEFRQPTFGILSATKQPSTTLLETRKDILSYTVFTLDLEQKASTELDSAKNLPSDLWKVVPLPLPASGALLVGTNELVHVEQGGKVNAVAVNEFARLASDYMMTDQSDLNMKLEGCHIEPLDPETGDLVMVLNDGSLAIIGFQLSGRSVGGLKVTRVAKHHGGSILESASSCAAVLQDYNIFVGSEDGDSALLGWSRSGTNLSRKRSHAQMLGEDGEEEDEEEESEDDLYESAPAPVRAKSSSTGASGNDASAYRFEVYDTLPSLGPINNVCFGRSSTTPKGQLDFLAGIGRGKGSRLASMSRETRPETIGTTSFENVKNAWSINALTTDAAQDYDNLLFCYDGENTQMYDISYDHDAKKPLYSERTGTEFEHEGETLAISTLGGGKWVVQCRRDLIKTYDATDLSLSQIIPVTDDETDAELKVVHTSFCDPYLLVIRDDSTIQLTHIDESGEAEAMETEGAIKDRKWLSGCLYAGDIFGGQTALYLLGDDGGLHVFNLSNFEEMYSAPMLSYLPPVLTQDIPQRRLGAKETLTELLVADVGTEDVRAPYLILRSALDDLTMYEPFNTDVELGTAGMRFRKVNISYIPKFDETSAGEDDGRPAPLKQMRVGNYSAIHVPGPTSSFILKEGGSLPKVLGVAAKHVKAISPLHHEGCEYGFAVVDDDGMRECRLPADLDFSSGWCVQRMKIGDTAEEVRHVAFHDEKQLYVVATCKDVDFYFAEEDGRHPEQDDISLRPQIPQYTLHLFSSNTHRIIQSLPMPYRETITSLKIMPLEISENTHEQKPMLVVGASSQRGEDMPAKGSVNVFSLLSVVPDPEIPESETNLHLFAREETKGAVTALEAFPGGFVGTAQGQKLMVRGLKEDGSCLPVAFLDIQCHTLSLKTLTSTGMWLAADAWKGLWFGGFTQEPYKLTPLGKSRPRMEVAAADFLPFDGALYLAVVDAAADLHILQYDPEDPKTVNGMRLLHRSTFHTGHFPTTTTLLPSSLSPIAAQPLPANDPDEKTPAHLSHLLLTSLSGSVALLTPVDEATYRRLGSLQAHLSSALEHVAGLNPRGYRAVEAEGMGTKGVVDGGLVMRVWELGSARRGEVLGRAGSDVWTVRGDCEVIGGGGLGFL